MTQKQGKFAAADALISVTVYKTTTNQKAGIKVVQKADGGIYITAIAKGGLLDGTRVDVGDKLLSINGRRMRPGQDTRDFMKLISSANEKVTIVVKKDGAEKKEKKPFPKSPGRGKKIVERDFSRAKDGSFDFNINPKLEEFRRSLTKFEDDKDQVEIVTRKMHPGQESGLALKKKDDMLFVSGIAADSIFVDTELEFGDRVVGVMGTNFMNYADENYAKTLLKRAKGEVKIIIEHGWNLLDKKIDLDAKHNALTRQESLVLPKKKGTIVKNGTILKDKHPAPPMTPPPEEEEEEEESPLKLSPEAPSSRKTVETEQDSQETSNDGEETSRNSSSWWNIPDSIPREPETSFEEPSPIPDKTPRAREPKPEPVIPQTIPRGRLQAPEEPAEETVPVADDKESTTPGKSRGSFTPQHPIMRTFSPKESPSPQQTSSPGHPRKFLPPMKKGAKKNYKGEQVDAGDVVTRMLNKLDTERQAIKERHRMRLNQSLDDSTDGGGTSSVEATPEKGRTRSPKSMPKRQYTSNRTYPSVGNSYSPANGSNYSSPTNSGLTRSLRKHQGGYLCISVRKKSERTPGVKLRRKDDMFILDKLPHDETRIPVGVQVLAINGNDSFSTVVKANELIDSRKQEVELVVSFEGLIAAWASGANGQQ